MKNGHLNLELVKKETLKYKTVKDFKNKSKSAYRWAFINGKLEEICLPLIYLEIKNSSKRYTSVNQFKKNDYKNFILSKKYDILDNITHLRQKKWNYNLVKKESLKYETRTDFKEGSGGAYNWAKLNNILNDICSHMIKRNQIHTLDKVKENGLKYNTKKEFRKKDSASFAWMVRNNHISEVCSHMTLGNKKIWTIDLAKEEMLKYISFTSFKRTSKSCYRWVKENGYVNELSTHMKDSHPLKKDIILEKANSYKYIHCFIKDNREDYIYSKEKKFKKELFQKMEYFKWDKESVIKESSQYKSIKEFKFRNYLAYRFSLDNNIKLNINKFIYWDYKSVFKKALEFSTRKDFKKFSKGAHHWAQSRGLLDMVCQHMKKLHNCFDQTLPSTLYYLYVEKEGNIAYKIGVTNHSLKDRFGSDMKYIRIVREIEFSTGKKALKLEQEIIKDFYYAKYKGHSLLYSGNTELFKYDILDWDK